MHRQRALLDLCRAVELPALGWQVWRVGRLEAASDEEDEQGAHLDQTPRNAPGCGSRITARLEIQEGARRVAIIRIGSYGKEGSWRLVIAIRWQTELPGRRIPLGGLS
jgi:hypothetical protein